LTGGVEKITEGELVEILKEVYAEGERLRANSNSNLKLEVVWGISQRPG